MTKLDFFASFRVATEEHWRETQIRDQIWGFQIQPGTRWNPGLSNEEISEYELAIDVHFSTEFRAYLQEMNGTGKPSLDVRGGSAEIHRLRPGFYSYPRDIELLRGLISAANEDRAQLAVTLFEEQGFILRDDAKLIPIYAHRYVVCTPDSDSSPVLSIWDSTDAIVYGNNLKEYLQKEIFPRRD